MKIWLIVNVVLALVALAFARWPGGTSSDERIGGEALAAIVGAVAAVSVLLQFGVVFVRAVLR